MPTRSPAVSGAFYPADAEACRRQVAELLARAQTPDIGPLYGGVVPHAGWAFSGLTAAHFYAALARQEPPETLVLFGAVHTWAVRGPSVYGSGTWRTPLGPLAIDAELASATVGDAEVAIADDPRAHNDEHSLEVQCPFICYLWPAARILPVAVPPDKDAPAVGRALARAVDAVGRRAVAVASSDLTHYGPRYGQSPAGTGKPALEWTHANDRRLIDRVLRLEAEGIVPEAVRQRNACGAGAIAAAIAYAVAQGATQGVLLHYTTSHEMLPMGPPSDMVGYAAIAFV